MNSYGEDRRSARGPANVPGPGSGPVPWAPGPSPGQRRVRGRGRGTAPDARPTGPASVGSASVRLPPRSATAAAESDAVRQRRLARQAVRRCRGGQRRPLPDGQRLGRGPARAGLGRAAGRRRRTGTAVVGATSVPPRRGRPPGAARGRRSRARRSRRTRAPAVAGAAPVAARQGQDPKRRSGASVLNILIAAFAVMIMLIGIGVVGGTYYFDASKTADALQAEAVDDHHVHQREAADGQAGRAEPHDRRVRQDQPDVRHCRRRRRGQELLQAPAASTSRASSAPRGTTSPAATPRAPPRSPSSTRGTSSTSRASPPAEAARGGRSPGRSSEQLDKDEILGIYLNSVTSGAARTASRRRRRRTSARSATTPAARAADHLAEAMVLVAHGQAALAGPERPGTARLRPDRSTRGRGQRPRGTTCATAWSRWDDLTPRKRPTS